MKERNNTFSQRAVRKSGERGVSIAELLIVVVMISIVAAFAVMQIAGAQRAISLSNSAREFMTWVEKARLDSLRRHAMSSGEMARVTIASANSYSITIDQNGDGTLDPPRTITIPATNGASFSGLAVPVTVRFNWRGRPVDSAGNLMSLAFSLRDASGNINPINLTSAGDASLGDSVDAGNVQVSEVSTTANIKAKTSVP